MATCSHTQRIDQTQQSPGSTALASLAGRFVSDCRTAADVRARAAHVRAFRAGLWLKRPVALPSPVSEPVAPVPVPALPALPEGCITVRGVLEATAAHFGTTVEALRSDSRKQPLCRRRQIAMYVAHRLTGRSFPFIALHIGKRDHTTVLHGVRAVQALLDSGDANTAAAVEAIAGKLTDGRA
jgi:hypothetical protein